MATYSYRCDGCHHIFELNLPMRDHSRPTQEPCPYCHESRVRQIVQYTPQIVPRETLSISKRLPQDWKNFLTKLDQKNPNSNMKNSKFY